MSYLFVASSDAVTRLVENDKLDVRSKAVDAELLDKSSAGVEYSYS